MADRKFHPSHQSDAYHKAVLEFNTPPQPLTCRFCGWQGSFSTMCTVCVEMVKILANRPSHYWLDLDARDRIQQRLKRQEEGPIGFTQ